MSVPYIQANTNGRLHSAGEPSLSPLNRGFLYGDGIYEVWRTYTGVIFGWQEHWRRLEFSAQALGLALPWSPPRMLEEIRRTVGAFRGATGFDGEIYVRLQITRGDGAIGLDPALADEPGYVLLVQPSPSTSGEKYRAGFSLSLGRDLRRNPVASLNPAWKTGNYLNNILGLREARSRGADDVVLLNLAGEVTEASTSNIGFVREGAVVTPPLTAGILAGITRAFVLEKICPDAGLTARESVVLPADLGEMEECFVLSTTKEIAPVSSLDQFRFKVGPGTATERLRGAFARFALAYASAHPELRV